jgi:hypothetical protein
MRRPRVPDWIDIRVVSAFGALVIAAALLVGALNTGHTDKKADTAKSQSATAKKRSTGAVAGTLILRNRLALMGRCLLRKGLTPQARAKCINLTLPVAQRGLPGLAGQQGRPGAVGKQGLPGVRGPTGPAGPRGKPGPLGPKGDPCLASFDPDCTGPQGDPGAKGDAGGAGPQGERGPKGDVGSTGSKGEPGPAGADSTVPGPPGPAGPAGPPGAGGATGATGPPVASFTFSFTDGQGVVQTRTCVDPDGDLNYACQ